MTAKLRIRFKKQVPIGAPLRLKGEMTKMKGRLLEGRSELMLADGTLAAEAYGTYLEIPDDQLEQYKSALAWWRVDE